jgi:hypothetical protein
MTAHVPSGKQVPDNTFSDSVRADSFDLSRLDELNLRLTDGLGKELFAVVFSRSAADQPQLTFSIQGPNGVQTGLTVFDVRAPRRPRRR